MSKQPINNRSRDLKDVHLLKDEQIMKYFGISRSCLYQWRKRKEIPYTKIGSTNYYIEEIIVKMLFLRGDRLPKDFDDDLKL